MLYFCLKIQKGLDKQKNSENTAARENMLGSFVINKLFLLFYLVIGLYASNDAEPN